MRARTSKEPSTLAKCPHCGGVLGCECKRCGWTWTPEDLTKKPRWCPHCNSPYWDKERQQGKS